MHVESVYEPQLWNTQLSGLPLAHVLQTWEWGEFKRRTTGWTPARYLYRDDDGDVLAAASVLTRRIGLLRLMYVSKGPVFAKTDTEVVGDVLDHLQSLARGAIWLKIDPDIVVATGLPPEADPDANHPHQPDPAGQQIVTMLKARRWRFSDDQIQFRNTLTLDLTLSENDLLAGMSQSTRRKIRQADKRDVVVRQATSEDEWRALYELYLVTGERQEFTIRPWAYYHQLWQSFHQAGMAHILMAEYQDELLGGVVLFHFGARVWYFYGMSADVHRDRQPNYALQWAAIRWAKAQGYHVYDWWGAPNHFSEDDPMWGVYRFKRGFGSQVVQTVGAWDYVPYPPLYWLYTKAAPHFTNWLRRRKS